MTDQIVESLNNCQGKLHPAAHKIALSLLTWHSKRGVWTPKQRELAIKLIAEVADTEKKKTSMVADITPLISILASSNMVAPSLRIIKGGATYKLKLDKKDSSIEVIRDGDWAGQFTADGCYVPRKKADLAEVNRVFDDIMAVLIDPIGYARTYGALTGHCSFCAKPLTDPRSQTAGYGEICANRYRLAWG